jgi:hypothetical protein
MSEYSCGQTPTSPALAVYVFRFGESRNPRAPKCPFQRAHTKQLSVSI